MSIADKLLAAAVVITCALGVLLLSMVPDASKVVDLVYGGF
jgi:hypothetical protein